jgi:hypothetical protein
MRARRDDKDIRGIGEIADEYSIEARLLMSLRKSAHKSTSIAGPRGGRISDAGCVPTVVLVSRSRVSALSKRTRISDEILREWPVAMTGWRSEGD